MKTIMTAMLISMTLVGCATGPKPLYHWGSFPEQTYLMYSHPGKAAPSAQISKFEAEIEKSKGRNLAVPPGLYAHLGLMYLQENQFAKASEYFQLERQVYPESTVIMDRLLKKTNTPVGQAK